MPDNVSDILMMSSRKEPNMDISTIHMNLIIENFQTENLMFVYKRLN